MNLSSLPPNVEGPVQGHVRLHVPFVIWSSHFEEAYGSLQFRVTFWGQQGSRVLVPYVRECYTTPHDLNTVLDYDVCCSLKQFRRYLSDMRCLELVVCCERRPVASCVVTQLQNLDLGFPSAGLVPILCHENHDKLGEAFVSLSIFACQKDHFRSHSFVDCLNRQNATNGNQNNQCSWFHNQRTSSKEGFHRRKGDRSAFKTCNEPFGHSYSCHHCFNYKKKYFQCQTEDNSKSESKYEALKFALSQILERAVELRNKGLNSSSIERVLYEPYAESQLEDFVESIFRDDSSPDESLIDTLFLSTSTKRTKPSARSKPSKRTERSEARDSSSKSSDNVNRHQSKSSDKSKEVSSLRDSTPARELQKSFSKPETPKAAVNQHVDCISSEPQQDMIVSEIVNKPKMDLPVPFEYPAPERTSTDLSLPTQSKCGFGNGISRFGRPWSEKHVSVLNLTVVSVQLNDFGVKLLGRKTREWSFRLEVKVPVLKGEGLGTWDQKGHRMPADIQSAQFISCLYKDSVVMFSQSKTFRNVNNQQDLQIKLEARELGSHQRRFFGNCSLPLWDLSDARVILPISTVQPNAQLSLSISSDVVPVDSKGKVVEPQKKKSKDTYSENLNDKRVTFLDDQYSDQHVEPSMPLPNTSVPSLKLTSVPPVRLSSVEDRLTRRLKDQTLLEQKVDQVDRAVQTSGKESPTKFISAKDSSASVRCSDTTRQDVVTAGGNTSVNKLWTVFIEKATNLPPEVSCSYVTLEFGRREELRTEVSVDNAWDWSHLVSLQPHIIKCFNFKLWQSTCPSPTSTNVSSFECESFIGEATVDLGSLRYISCLSGWYTLYNQGKAVGQIKISIWPKESAGDAQIGTTLTKKQVLPKKDWNDVRDQLQSLGQTLQAMKSPQPSRKLPVNEFLKRSFAKQMSSHLV